MCFPGTWNKTHLNQLRLFLARHLCAGNPYLDGLPSWQGVSQPSNKVNSSDRGTYEWEPGFPRTYYYLKRAVHFNGLEDQGRTSHRRRWFGARWLDFGEGSPFTPYRTQSFKSKSKPTKGYLKTTERSRSVLVLMCSFQSIGSSPSNCRFLGVGTPFL